jgi:hypothetical protein
VVRTDLVVSAKYCSAKLLSLVAVALSRAVDLSSQAVRKAIVDAKDCSADFRKQYQMSKEPKTFG